MQNIKSYILPRILGAFEIAILMRQGLKRFDGTPKETLLSFWILALTTPLSYLATDIKKPLGAEDFSTSYIFTIDTIVSIVAFIIDLLLIYGFAKYVTKNTEKIWLFYTVGNWVSVIFIPLAIIFYYFKFNGLIELKTIEDINILLTLYGYWIAGFVIYHIFRPPWELAAALTLGVLVMGQVIHDAIYRLASIPVVDYMEVFG